ncbi:unnamed protein product, partial [Mesorhabditis belari]|uniref:Uncharacterized protein n=1 Tax=Mesorhabditis belari TaxID=2138241 RepID=A0AAF3EUL3_9BILA
MWTSEEVQKKAAWALTLVGLISMFNGAIASAYEAEKNYDIEHFINTHWITCIQLFSGLAFLLQERKYAGSACMTLSVHSISLVISLCAVVADFSNLLYLLTNRKEREFGKPDKRQARMISYCGVDTVLSLTAIPLNYLIVNSILALDRTCESRCIRLLILGTMQIVLSVFKLCAYFMEIWAMRKAKEGRLLFINYTLDEPVWIVICVLCGVMCVLASRGTRLLRYASLAIASISILPSIFYLWLDYRWYTSVIFLQKNATDHMPRIPLVWLFGFSFIHIGVLIASVLAIFQLVTSRNRSTQLSFVRIFSICSFLFLVLAGLIFLIDLYALANQVFYRIFHGSEQKAPFLLLLCSIFAILSINPTFSAFSLPSCLTVCLLTVKSTIFLLISYCYLTYKGYFREQLGDLLLNYDAKGSEIVTTGGVLLHTVEALIHLIAATSAIFLTTVIMRIAHLRKETNAVDIQLNTKKYQALLRWIGVVDACGSFIILASTIYSFAGSSETMHPLIIIFHFLYHISLAISLIIFPLYQICVSERIHEIPIARHTLLILSAIRFFSILTQLDYRGIGDDFYYTWQLHHFVEIASMFGCFFSTILVLRIENLINPLVLNENFGVMEFDNPLAGELESSNFSEGYIQLRQEESIS